MTYIALKELVRDYARRYGVSFEEAIELIKEDLKAVRDKVAVVGIGALVSPDGKLPSSADNHRGTLSPLELKASLQ
jgi:hypothetical protein